MVTAVKHGNPRIRLCKRRLYINHTLVAAPLPQKRRILPLLYKFTVHKNIYIFYQRGFHDIFPHIACVEPNIFVRVLFFDFSCKRLHTVPVRTVQRISTGKRNAFDIRLVKLIKNLCLGSVIKQQSPIRVPCHRILASLTAMLTSCHPQDNTKPVTI